VRTSPYRGLKFGGELGTFFDADCHIQVKPRVAGEYSLTVIDPARFVQGASAMENADAVVAAVSAVILRETRALYGLAVEGRSVQASNVLPRLNQELPGRLGSLDSFGVSVQMGSLQVSFSDEDRKALIDARAPRAAAQRAEAIARMKAAETRKAGPATTDPPPAGTDVAALPAKKKTGLVVGLGLAAVVVVGLAVVLVLHFRQGGSTDKAHESPAAHDAKHGKH
jgi:hypothetical protein